ncbi:MAG: hypothetical protein AAF203_06075, partial [Pseudomonadota bacterium]
MTTNQKSALICGLCLLVSGLLGSFKSFQLDQEFQTEVAEKQNREISQWVAQSVEQKLTQLESSVSYLDKSTVESLKRFGCRYFAYSFKKGGEWSIKWKVLSDFGKDQILGEVNQLNFDELSQKKRQWKFNKENQPIYVAPVKLAQSHQLKKGFLIFGLEKNFFSALHSVDHDVFLVTPDKKSLFNSLSDRIRGLSDLFVKGSNDLTAIEAAEGPYFLTSYFSPVSQLWYVRKAQVKDLSFFASPQMSYFLLGSLLGWILFLLLSQTRMSLFSLGALPALLKRNQRVDEDHEEIFSKPVKVEQG